MLLGERIRSLRAKKEWTQTELGKKLGVSKQTISSYENGSRQPDPDMIRALAELFQVTSDYLLGRKGDERERPKKEGVTTIAGFRLEGYDNLSPEVLKEIENYIEYVISRHGKKEPPKKE